MDTFKMGFLRTFCVSFVNLQIVLSFNLDTTVPIVKIGNRDSFFGFSVAQHIKGEDGPLEHTLLIGAPRDNVTVPTSPSSVRQTVRPGAVHQCPLSSFQDDCEQLELMVTEPRRDSRGNLEEDRSDQWLGVSVASSGTVEGKAMACAHRWKKVAFTNQNEISAIWGSGMCVGMLNSLDQDNFLDVCSDQSTDRGHQDYGFCQAGTSIAASKENEILLGAAGVSTWRGMAAKSRFFMNLGDDISVSTTRHQDYDEIRQPIMPDVEYFSYLGLATAISRLIDGEVTYVAGAPRSNEVGQVILYKHGDGWLEKQITYSGEKFGSYFGYSLATVDLNNDQMDDLIVGAPFYFDKEVGGAIYVYISGPRGLTSDTQPIKIPSRKMTKDECKALKCVNARFGFSLSGLGDVDQDGFGDLAVGAPFEGNGVVYIFRGSETGIMTEYSQRIEAADLMTARPLTTFGYSLSGGVDMDRNTYPDLVVGAYKSDKVVVLRARPVINVKVAVVNTPPEIDMQSNTTRCNFNGREARCFTLSVCFEFTAKPVDQFNERINLDYRIEAETFIPGVHTSRVIFHGVEGNNKHIIARTSRLNPQSSSICKEEPHKVYLQKGIRDFLRPINFKLTYKLKEQPPPVMNEGDPLPEINTFPVLNTKMAEIFHTVEFKKNCGEDKRCQSDLQLSAKFHLNSEGPDYYILRQGQDTEPTLDISVRNVQEDAHDASLNITLPENLYYLGTNEAGQQYSCIPDKVTKRFVVCSLGNPMLSGELVEFQIRFDPSSLTTSTSELSLGLAVSTTSDETHPEDNTRDITLKVVVQTDIRITGWSTPLFRYFSGEIVGESAIQYENQIGSEVIHTYEVKNIGNGSVSECIVTVHWPYELANYREQGKHLLYLLEEPMIFVPADSSARGTCTIDERYVNPVKIKLYEENMLKYQIKPSPAQNDTGSEPIEIKTEVASSRSKRDTPEAISSEEGKKIATLDCDLQTAKCFPFTCKVGPLDKGKDVEIKIRSRLWNSTFLMEFVDYSYVKVQSKAYITIPEALNVKQLRTDNDEAKALTQVIPDIAVKAPEPIPLWIIIVAVLAGIILLVIIIILLWKCGFFQRKKADDGQKHKAKVEKKKHTHKYQKTYNNVD